MTTVHVSMARDDGTSTTAATGVLVWEPTTRRESGDDVVLPQGFTVALSSGEATVTVAPSGLTWCWRVTERVQDGTVRYVSVPDSATTVEYVDLPDVDPDTLVAWTPADPEAAYLAALAGLDVASAVETYLLANPVSAPVDSVDGKTGAVYLSSTYVTQPAEGDPAGLIPKSDGAGSYSWQVGGADGEDGTDGREVELQTTATHVQWRYVGDVAWTDLIALSAITGPAGADGAAGVDGEDGLSVELQTTATHIQWRLVGGTWADLVALSAITGPAGADGEDGAAGADGEDLTHATPQTINAQTGAYTLIAADAGKLVTLTLTAAADLTVPANVFTAGQRIDIADRGTARVTVVAGSGMTVNPPAGGSLVMEGQYAYASLVFLSATEADIVGLVAAS